MKRLMMATAMLATVIVGTAAAAGASGDSGRDYGQHVATCAQTVGFNTDHNPGMHQGFARWPGDTCIP